MVLADLTEGNGTGTVTVGFLDASGGGCGFACGLGGELFAGGFASGGFTGGLLGTVGGVMINWTVMRVRGRKGWC